MYVSLHAVIVNLSVPLPSVSKSMSKDGSVCDTLRFLCVCLCVCVGTCACECACAFS